MKKQKEKVIYIFTLLKELYNYISGIIVNLHNFGMKKGSYSCCLQKIKLPSSRILLWWQLLKEILKETAR